MSATYCMCEISVPRPGMEPGPRQWKPGILTTRPPGNSLNIHVLDMRGVMVWITSPKRYVGVLIPGTCERDLVWKQGRCQYNQVKMKSLGWPWIQHDWCPYKKRKIWTQTQRKCPAKMEAEVGVTQPWVKNHLGPPEEPRKDPPLEAL